MSKSAKSLIVVTLFFVVVLIIGVIEVFVNLRNITMPPCFYTSQEYYLTLAELKSEYEEAETTRTNKEYRSLVEQELNFKAYFYCEKDLKYHDGLMLVAIRTMIIDESLSGYDYCLTFVHEAMHLKRFAKQENYICFETFKYLYESKDRELHNFGVKYAIEQLQGDCLPEDDCHQQIIRYLRQDSQ